MMNDVSCSIIVFNVETEGESFYEIEPKRSTLSLPGVMTLDEELKKLESLLFNKM